MANIKKLIKKSSEEENSTQSAKENQLNDEIIDLSSTYIPSDSSDNSETIDNDAEITETIESLQVDNIESDDNELNEDNSSEDTKFSYYSSSKSGAELDDEEKENEAKKEMRKAKKEIQKSGKQKISKKPTKPAKIQKSYKAGKKAVVTDEKDTVLSFFESAGVEGLKKILKENIVSKFDTATGEIIDSNKKVGSLLEKNLRNNSEIVKYIKEIMSNYYKLRDTDFRNGILSEEEVNDIKEERLRKVVTSIHIVLEQYEDRLQDEMAKISEWRNFESDKYQTYIDDEKDINENSVSFNTYNSTADVLEINQDDNENTDESKEINEQIKKYFAVKVPDLPDISSIEVDENEIDLLFNEKELAEKELAKKKSLEEEESSEIFNTLEDTLNNVSSNTKNDESEDWSEEVKETFSEEDIFSVMDESDKESEGEAEEKIVDTKEESDNFKSFLDSIESEIKSNEEEKVIVNTVEKEEKEEKTVISDDDFNFDDFEITEEPEQIKTNTETSSPNNSEIDAFDPEKFLSELGSYGKDANEKEEIVIKI